MPDHGSSVSCFKPSAILWVISSTPSTLQVIAWTALRTVEMSATRDHPSRTRAAAPARRRRIDERAEVAHGGDASGNHRAGDDRAADLVGVRALLLFEQRTPRDDEVLAAFLELDDPELVDAPDVRRGVGTGRVDLGDGTEAAQAGDADFVSALHLPFDLAFDRKSGAERVLELPRGRGASHELPGECQAAFG